MKYRFIILMIFFANYGGCKSRESSKLKIDDLEGVQDLSTQANSSIVMQTAQNLIHNYFRSSKTIFEKVEEFNGLLYSEPEFYIEDNLKMPSLKKNLQIQRVFVPNLSITKLLNFCKNII